MSFLLIAEIIPFQGDERDEEKTQFNEIPA